MNNNLLKITVAAAALALAGHAAAEITFYEHDNYGGRAFTTRSAVENFTSNGFNDRASSVVVQRDSWEICEDANFGGQCRLLQPGRYPALSQMGLNDRISSVRMVSRSDEVTGARNAPQSDNDRMREAARAQAREGKVVPMITFFENDNYGGRTFTTRGQVDSLQRDGFNDRASSVVVQGEGWEVCEAPAYSGRCMVLRPGNYPSLTRMGLNDRISSVRTVGGSDRITDERYAPAPLPVYDARRRDNERLYQANVSSVRAVVGKPEQRCWIEQQQVPQEQINNAVPGGIGGALLGGILGHQVGGGSGRDMATVLGAVGGAVVGSQVGKNYGKQAPQTQGVKRCTTKPASTKPDYWDVTYRFRGQEHRVQMANEPGATVTVNQAGEPRT
jgi:uncharacterized protein YcfJ/predicted pyridoxine 5'-phosphate oxidase superfamily flavin-nucleotide-binding protein